MYNARGVAMVQFRHKSELTVAVLICTLGLFLFAAPAGPYSAVHGPVTALRALYASLSLFWWIAVAALNALGFGFLARRSDACLDRKSRANDCNLPRLVCRC